MIIQRRNELLFVSGVVVLELNVRRYSSCKQLGSQFEAAEHKLALFLYAQTGFCRDDKCKYESGEKALCFLSICFDLLVFSASISKHASQI